MRKKFLALFGFLASLTLFASCGGDNGDSAPDTSTPDSITSDSITSDSITSDSITSECQHSFTIDNHDETHHWKECECGAQSEKVAHDMLSQHNATHHWTECECGQKTSEVAHDYSTAKKDDTHHWTECECGEKTSEVAHDYSTAKKDDTHHWTECECGAQSEKVAHDYTTAKKDATHHWTECECGQKSSEVAHDMKTQHNDTHHWTECECGEKTSEVAHDYSIAKKDETHHWKECECGAQSDKVAHEYSEWKKDETQHWKECECGAQSDKAAHEYSGWNTEDEKYDYKACECGALDKSVKFHKQVSLINQDFLLTGTSFKLNISGVDNYASVESIKLGAYDLGKDLNALNISADLKADTQSHGKQTIIVTVKDNDGASHEIKVPVTLITKEISSKEEFIAVLPTADNKAVYGYYVLTKDIDVTGNAPYIDSDETVMFAGTLDGQGHMISSASNAYGKTVFGILRSATIKNVTIKDNWRSNGGLVAKISENSTFENVTFQYASGAASFNGSWLFVTVFSNNTLKDVTVVDVNASGTLFGAKFAGNTFENVTIPNGYAKMGTTPPDENDNTQDVSYDQVTKVTTTQVTLNGRQDFILDGDTSFLDLGDYSGATILSIKTSKGSHSLYGLSSDVATDALKKDVQNHGEQNIIVTVIHEGKQVEITVPVTIITKSIKTMSELQATVKVTNSHKVNIYGYYILGNDIAYDETGFTAVKGDTIENSNAFCGTLDGRGNTITCNQGNKSDFTNGIFGVMNGAVLKNLTIVEENFLQWSGRPVLAKCVYNTTIENVNIHINGGTVNNAAIVSENLSNVTMKDVTIESKVELAKVFDTEQGTNTYENVIIKANVTRFSATNENAPSGVTINNNKS